MRACSKNQLLAKQELRIRLPATVGLCTQLGNGSQCSPTYGSRSCHLVQCPPRKWIRSAIFNVCVWLVVGPRTNHVLHRPWRPCRSECENVGFEARMGERHHVPQAEMVRSWDRWSEVWSESHRCIIAQFVHWDIPVSFLSYSSDDGRWEWSSCANLYIAVHFSSVKPNFFKVWITIFWISLETIVNSIRILYDTSLPLIVDHKKLFLCVGFAVPRTVRSPFLDDVVRDGESIQSPATQIWTGFSFNQEMSTSARNHSLIQRKKNILSIAPPGIVSQNSKNSTLPMSRIIPFEFLLKGLQMLFCCKSA